MDQIVIEFADLLGPNSEVVKIINCLGNSTPKSEISWQKQASNQQYLDGWGSGVLSVKGYASASNVLVPTPIGKGASGTIFGSAYQEFAYKNIELSSAESTIRDIFLEVFFSLLSKDPLYGQNICSVIKMYRSPTQIILKMEKIEGRTMYATRYNTWDELKATLTEVNKTLQYFKSSCNFHHRDLHGGNVMVKSDGSIKILDMGRACLTVCNSTFTSHLNPVCRSADMLMLVASIYLNNNLDPAVKEKLRLLLTPATFEEFNGLYAALGPELGAEYRIEWKTDQEAILIQIANAIAVKRQAQEGGRHYPMHQFYPSVLAITAYWGDVGPAYLTMFDENIGARLASIMSGGSKKSRRKHRRRRRGSRVEKLLDLI